MLKLLALAALAGTVACQTVAGPDRAPDRSGDESYRSADALPLERFRGDTAGYAGYSGLKEPARLVIRDAEAWASLWATVHEGMWPQPALPTIDFGTEMVVAAALGTRPTGGYAIRIAEATQTAAGLTVSVEAWSPGEECGVTAAITAPVDLVRLPRAEGPVAFEESSAVFECS